jgi:adenylate cyclase
VRLIDAASRMQMWADLFERDQGDRFEVQDEIARRLARELHVGIPAALSRRTIDEPAREPAIDELIARGLTAQMRGPAAENITEALRYFEEALKRQPDLVPALVGAGAQRVMGSVNFILDPGPNLAEAERLLDRAQQLAPDTAIIPYWLGVLAKARGRYDDALRLFERALDLNPSIASAHQQIGSTLTLMGRADEAMPHILYGMRLSPKDPTLGIGCLLAGMAEIELGHDSDALEWFRRSAALVPNNPNIHRLLAAAYALTGDKAKAVTSLAEFKRLAPVVSVERLTRAATRHDDGGKSRSRALRGFALALDSAS